MRPLYIFDLDGTLCDITPRRHFVEGEQKDWRAFFAACVNDTPKRAVIIVLNTLVDHDAEVWVWSGRSDEVRFQTEDWLENATGLCSWEDPTLLRMRKAGDHQPDETLKRSWYDALPEVDKQRLIAVFDDRNRMVKMWRDLGITCFQVAPGDF